MAITRLFSVLVPNPNKADGQPVSGGGGGGGTIDGPVSYIDLTVTGDSAHYLRMEAASSSTPRFKQVDAN